MDGNPLDETGIESLNRRSVLQSAVAATGITGLGLASRTSASAAQDRAFTVTDAQLKTPEAAAADRSAIEGAEEANALASAIQQDTGRESENQVISFSLETDDASVQEKSPAITAVPMKPSAKDWSEVSTADIAVQFALTVEENGSRTPISTMGMSYKSSDTSGLTTMDSGVELDVYGANEAGNVGVVETNSVSAPTSGGIGTLGLGCDGCKVVVGAICVGVNTTLGRSGCISRCIPSVISNPLLGTGCSGLCIALTSTFGKIACGSGGLSEAACRVIDFCYNDCVATF